MDSSLTDGLNTIIDKARDVLSIQPTTAAAIGGAVAGAALTGGAVALSSSLSKRRKKRSRSSKRTRKKSIRHRRRKHKYKYARTAGKSKDRSHKRIRMTKNGQPYIIQANGRARFISKSSARRSRKLKGGRY